MPTCNRNKIYLAFIYLKFTLIISPTNICNMCSWEVSLLCRFIYMGKIDQDRTLYWGNVPWWEGVPLSHGYCVYSKYSHVTLYFGILRLFVYLYEYVQMAWRILQLRAHKPILLNGQNYDERSLFLYKVPDRYFNIREVTLHARVEPGTYVIIPTTYHVNKEGGFFMRIFTEKAADTRLVPDGCSNPEAACWTSHHWVELRGMCYHSFHLIDPLCVLAWPRLA